MRAVIDTNVLFTGVTAPGSEAGGVLAAWLENRFRPCVSTALALEYEEVLRRKLRGRRARLAMLLLRELLRHARYTEIRISTRPLSPDPDDDFVIDCAFNAGAAIVTENVRDFAPVPELLGLAVLTPTAFLGLL